MYTVWIILHLQFNLEFTICNCKCNLLDFHLVLLNCFFKLHVNEKVWPHRLQRGQPRPHQRENDLELSTDFALHTGTSGHFLFVSKKLLCEGMQDHQDKGPKTTFL